MRVIHIMECFAGGTFEFLLQLVKNLDSSEHIVIYGMRENTPREFTKKFPEKTIFIPWKNAQREINIFKDAKALLELVSLLKYKKKEYGEFVLHLHSSKAGFLGRIAARILGLDHRTIYTANGVSFLRKDINMIKKYFYIMLEKTACVFGGKVVACSLSEKEEFLKYGIKDVLVINNGIETFNIEEKESKDNIVIGTVARITYQKNPLMFNWIAKQFTNMPNIKFMWIGDGVLRKELNSKNIEVTGWLDKNDVQKSLNNFDVYLSTALWEGLPFSVLEAMYVKLPVVLYSCVGNRDLVHNDDSGYLFSDRETGVECLKKLVENKSLRSFMGNKAHGKVKMFYTSKIMAESYAKLYNDMLSIDLQ